MHFEVSVLIPYGLDDDPAEDQDPEVVWGEALQQLERYSCYREVPEYVCYTRAHAEEELQALLEQARDCVRMYPPGDPVYRWGREQLEKWSQASVTRFFYYQANLRGGRLDEHRMEVYSTDNPEARWDSARPGNGWIRYGEGHEADFSAAGNIVPVWQAVSTSRITYAYIWPDGEWLDWDQARDRLRFQAARQWVRYVRRELSCYLDHRLVVVDCHA